MKKLSIICLAVFCIAAGAIVYNESNFSALGRMYQLAPETQTGSDNDPGRGMHHTGEDCARCHRVGGRAESYLWTMSGTLYSDRLARSVLKGGEVILQDREGNVISMTTNRAGNFWTTSQLASDPYTVGSYHGGPPFEPLYTLDAEGNLITPAPPNDPRTWKYKTWVRKGNAERPMMTIAGAGGNWVTNRMSCNMHHGGVAHRSGALWVSPAATLPSYPDSGLSYRKHIYPVLRSKCSPCHIPGKTNTPVNMKSDLDTPSTTIDYSGGVDLMTYEGSNVAGIIKSGVQSVVDNARPEQSLLLLKTVWGGEPHGGGVFWDKRSADYLAIRQWIKEGAILN